jgi:hypothetical protein
MSTPTREFRRPEPGAQFAKGRQPSPGVMERVADSRRQAGHQRRAARPQQLAHLAWLEVNAPVDVLEPPLAEPGLGQDPGDLGSPRFSVPRQRGIQAGTAVQAFR